MGLDSKAPAVCVASLGVAVNGAAWSCGELSAHQKTRWLSGGLWAPKGPSAEHGAASRCGAERGDALTFKYYPIPKPFAKGSANRPTSDPPQLAGKAAA